MTKQKRVIRRGKETLDTLRFFTSVAGTVMGRPMSPSHREAIASYAARKLPERALGSLHTKAGGTAALAFIVKTLEQPRLPH